MKTFLFGLGAGVALGLVLSYLFVMYAGDLLEGDEPADVEALP